MNSAVLGALGGFFGALITLGVPLAAFLYRIDRRARKAVRLLTGSEEVEQDGVLPRLRRVEAITETVVLALDDADAVEFDLADVEEAAADG